jgi:hypothetical protein
VDGTGFFLGYVAFIGCGLLTAIAQGRFFQALERREPGVAAPDGEVLDQIIRQPSHLVPIIFRATRVRLSAFAQTWPYPEVERLRKWALVSITVTFVIFGWLLLKASG